MTRSLSVLIAVLLLCSCQDTRTPTQRGQDWFRPYGQASVAACVIRHESSGDPHALSPGGQNAGLFQINTVHRRAFEALTHKSWYPWIFDADLNSQYAVVLWKQVGWGAWSGHRHC